MNSAEGSINLMPSSAKCSSSSAILLEEEADDDDAEDSEEVVRCRGEVREVACEFALDCDGATGGAICFVRRRSRRGFLSFDLTLVETAERCSCRGKVR